MIISLGSTNPIKIQALEETLKDYPMLEDARILSFAVPSGVSDQPLTLEETIRGAKNRAKHAYEACLVCTYSVGIESGLFEAPGTQTGFLETSVCCIYDGKHYYIGLANSIELPPPILELVLKHNLNLSQACYEVGLASDPKLGASEGLRGILTKSRINRKTNTKFSVISALVQIENPKLYHEYDGTFPNPYVCDSDLVHIDERFN